MSATGKLDRPGGSRYFEVIDTVRLSSPARHRLPSGAACGRSLRDFLDRRAV